VLVEKTYHARRRRIGREADTKGRLAKQSGQAEAHRLSGRAQTDRGGAEGSVGEGEENFVGELYQICLIVRSSFCA
jgi:hypothetical protein